MQILIMKYLFLILIFISLVSSNLYGSKNFLQKNSKATWNDIETHLASNPSDLDKQGERNETMLITAITNSKFDIAKQLVGKGANITIQSYGKQLNDGSNMWLETPLDFAVYQYTQKKDNSCLELIKLLAEKGAFEVKEQYSGASKSTTPIALLFYKENTDKAQVLQEIIKSLPDKSLIINTVVKYGENHSEKTLLQWAAEKHDLQSCTSLIQKGAHRTLSTDGVKTPLYVALEAAYAARLQQEERKKFIPIIELLVGNGEGITDDALERVMKLDLKEELEKIIELLPNDSEWVDKPIKISHSTTETLLCWAAKKRYVSICKQLVGKKPKTDLQKPLDNVINSLKGIDNRNNNAIEIIEFFVKDHNAVVSQENIFDLLVKQNGYELNTADSASGQALQKIIELLPDESEFIKELMKHKYGYKDQITLLHWAAQMGDEKSCQQLITKGVQVNAQTLVLKNYQDKPDATPLHLAIKSLASARNETIKTFMNIITILLNNEANVNIQNVEGNTPLHCAIEEFYKTSKNVSPDLIRNDLVEAIKLLVLHKASLEKANEQGYTPVGTALNLEPQSDKKNLDLMLRVVNAIVDSLPDHGQYINAPRNTGKHYNNGSTLLHWAVDKGNLELCKKLVEKYADPNRKGKYGKTPLQEAVDQYNYDENIIKLLIQAGGTLDEQKMNSLKSEIRKIFQETQPEQKYIDKQKAEAEAATKIQSIVRKRQAVKKLSKLKEAKKAAEEAERLALEKVAKRTTATKTLQRFIKTKQAQKKLASLKKTKLEEGKGNQLIDDLSKLHNSLKMLKSKLETLSTQLQSLKGRFNT